MTHGHFVWHDLATRDVAKALSFYATLLGWEVDRVSETPNGSYTHLKYGGEQGATFGGAMTLSAEWGDAPPHWGHYIEVSDLDAALATVGELGGKVEFGPLPIPDTGAFAHISSPQGVRVYLIQLDDSETPTPDYPPPQTWCWQTLVVSDLDAAKAFWSGLLGWTFSTMDMGGGTEVTVIGMGEAMVADVEVQADAHARWDGHVAVADVKAAHATAVEAGAGTILPPTALGEMGHMAVITDPTGAPLGLFQSNGPG